MKRSIFIFVMIMLSLTSFGCNRTNGDIKNANTVATVTPSSADVSADVDDNVSTDADVRDNANASARERLVKKAIKIPYLVSNDITIQHIDKTLESPKGIVKYLSIKISGLRNLSIQKQLNSSIEKSIENAVKAYAVEADEVNEFYCYVEFSFNNLLSISLRDNTNALCNGFLYRLTDGKRLLLKELFTTGTDYVALINDQIPLAILVSDISEEDILREPFITIDSNQDFYLTKEKLYVIFKKNQSGFAKQIGIGIPRSSIDAYMDIIDRAGRSQQKPTNTNSKRTIFNNIFITETGKVLKTSAGRVSVHYPVITGLRDHAFEKNINASVQLAITKIQNSKKLKNAVNLDNDEIFAAINSEVTFNHFGLICIATNAGGYYTSLDLQNEQINLCFDLKKKKQIHISDIFRNYAKKDKAFAPAFTALVKKNILLQYSNGNSEFAKEINRKFTFDFIMNNSTIRLGFDDFQIGVDFYLYFVFKDSAVVSNEYGQRIEFWHSIGNLPIVSLEDFFSCI